jgi:hypothetical protein
LGAASETFRDWRPAQIDFVYRQIRKIAVEDRYVLSNELGDGRVISQAPSLTKEKTFFSVLCPVVPSFPRIDAQMFGISLALNSKNHDLYLSDKGDIAHVSGLESLLQNVQSLLSMQQRESVFCATAGMRFFEYFDASEDSPWLALLLMLDVIPTGVNSDTLAAFPASSWPA